MGTEGRAGLVIEKWKTPIPRLTGREGRTVYVYLPPCAATDSLRRYPVLYMFDGHNVFFDRDATYGKSWRLREFLEGSGIEIMVVAVDCNHRPNNGRLSEYAPFSFYAEGFGSVPGRGRLFMDWLTGTLKPMIDSRYPTLPDRDNTFIAGSSMGGLMSLYAITAYNEYFSRAAALSPSVWFAGKNLRRLMRETDYTPGDVVYMDYGSGELRNHAGMLRAFMQTAETLTEQGVYVNARIVPGGEHCEACWEEQLPFVFDTLLYPGFTPPQPDEDESDESDEPDGGDGGAEEEN